MSELSPIQKAKQAQQNDNFDAKRVVKECFKDVSTQEFNQNLEQLQEEERESGENIYLPRATSFLKRAKEFDFVISGQMMLPNKESVLRVCDSVQSNVDQLKLQFSKLLEVADIIRYAENVVSADDDLFTIPREIKKCKEEERFSDLSKCLQAYKSFRGQQTPAVQLTVPLIEKEFKRAREALQRRVKNMTMATFNSGEVGVLIKLYRDVGQDPKIWNFIQQRVENAMRAEGTGGKSLEKACLEMEQAVPYWKMVSESLEQNDAELYQRNKQEIEETLEHVISDFDKWTRVIIENMRKAGLMQEMHEEVKKICLMWNRANERNTGKSSEQIQAILEDIRNQYEAEIRQRFEKVCRDPNTHIKVPELLYRIFDGKFLVFPREKYVSVLKDFMLTGLDIAHERAVVERTQDTISALQTLEQVGFAAAECAKRIQMHFQGPPITGHEQGLKGERELVMIFEDQLLRKLELEVTQTLHSGMLDSGVNWKSDDIELDVDGFVLEVVNICVKAKAHWGQYYDQLKTRVQDHVFNPFVYYLSKIGKTSENGRLRLELDARVLDPVFGGLVKNGSKKQVLEAVFTAASPLREESKRRLEEKFRQIQSTMLVQIQAFTS